jgi:hypothetical protein
MGALAQASIVAKQRAEGPFHTSLGQRPTTPGDPQKEREGCKPALSTIMERAFSPYW